MSPTAFVPDNDRSGHCSGLDDRSRTRCELNNGLDNGCTAEHSHRSYWYAVNTKPRKEDLVHKNLELKNVEVFLPKIEITRRRGAAELKLIEPLFPGYLFVRIVPEPKAIARVNWTPGVRRLLMSGSIPVPVPDEAIELLRWRVGLKTRGGPSWEEEFPTGTRVAVEKGPFAGLIGVVERPLPGKARVRVLLEFLERLTPVECDVRWLKRV